MGAFLCLEWVKKHAGKQFDLITNINVVDHVADKALEIATTQEEIELCKLAKQKAQEQIIEQQKNLRTEARHQARFFQH